MLKGFLYSISFNTFVRELFLMKILHYILFILAFALIVFNVTQLNFDNILSNDSVIAMIGIVASFCAILILLIFRMSKSIEDKLKD